MSINITLNDRVIIIEGEPKELKKIYKYEEYTDDKNCFSRSGYDIRKLKHIPLLKDIKGRLVGFAGLAKEIILFCSKNNIKINKLDDKREHFDFQQKEYSHDELRALFDPKFKYVEHQIKTLQAMLKTNKAILALPTSAGKSSIMAAWIKLTNLPTLILTDRSTLGKQLADDFNEKGIDCGFCSGNGVKQGYCMVSTIQSVKKIQDLPRFKMVLVDECFPGNTIVHTENGNKKISSLVKSKSTEKVYSYNAQTKEVELKPITNWFEKKTEFDTQIVVYANKNKIVSTPNHKYFVIEDSEYNLKEKKASELKVGDKLMTNPYGKELNNCCALNSFQKSALIGMVLGNSSLQNVNNNLARLRWTQGEKQLEYLKYKINIMRNLCGKEEPYFNYSGYNKEKKIYYKTTKSSKELREYYNLFYKDGVKNINNILNLIDIVSLAFWIMDDGCCHKYDSKEGQRCTYDLCTHSFTKEENEKLISFFKKKWGLEAKLKFDKRCEKYFIYFTVDSSMKISNMIREYIPRCMEYKLLDCDMGNFKESSEKLFNFGYKEITKIETIVPKTKTVYNITVEDNHNYFVGEGANVLVSNCHRSSAKSFQDFFVSFGCPLKYGFSASPSNGNLLDFAKIRQHLGSIIIQVKAEELMDNGVMAKAKINLVKTYCEETFDYPSANNIGIVHNDRRNKQVADIVEKHRDIGGICILIKNIEHGEILEKMIPGSVFLRGENGLDERVDTIKKFNNGEIPILIGSGILNEGISISNMKVLIMAGGGKAQTQTVQKIGRVLRITPEKKEGIFYDFVDVGNKYLYKHSKSRLAIYKQEGYKDIKLLDENLEEIKK